MQRRIGFRAINTSLAVTVRKDQRPCHKAQVRNTRNYTGWTHSPYSGVVGNGELASFKARSKRGQNKSGLNQRNTSYIIITCSTMVTFHGLVPFYPTIKAARTLKGGNAVGGHGKRSARAKAESGFRTLDSSIANFSDISFSFRNSIRLPWYKIEILALAFCESGELCSRRGHL